MLRLPVKIACDGVSRLRDFGEYSIHQAKNAHKVRAAFFYETTNIDGAVASGALTHL